MRNCVYYTVYGKNIDEYIKILLLSLKSLNRFFNKKDIYVYTDNDLSEILDYANVIQYDFGIGFAIPMAQRFKICKELMKSYDNILHVDADTIFINYLDELFSNLIDLEISVATENPLFDQNLIYLNFDIYKRDKKSSIVEHLWAGPLLNENEKKIYQNIDSICAGVFACNKTCYFIDEIFFLVSQLEIAGFRYVCRDQHAFCKYLLDKKCYNFNLQKFVSHEGPSIMNETNKLIFNSLSIVHFAGGVTSMNKSIIMEKLFHTNKIKDRNLLLSYLPKKIKFAELGVFKGEFSEIILKNLEPDELYLIDIFSGLMCSGDKDGNNIIYTNLDIEYYKLIEKYKDISNVKIIKNKTTDFLNTLSDDYLDGVYIDADHSHDSVFSDLELSRKKVKNNGYIIGHDYTREMFPGTFDAVNLFCDKYNLHISYLTEDRCPTYLIKNIKK